MDVALLSVAIIALAAFVAAPLYRRGAPDEPLDDTGEPPGRTTAGEQALFGALDDLEVDRASGLLDAGSYAAEKAALKARLDAAD
jgi:hypothetical protein